MDPSESSIGSNSLGYGTGVGGYMDSDPDVVLSYLDDKLQYVLGHVKKDFEGGVSAQNLGSKFGGYGSFLPSYQRYPARPNAKTPPKASFNNATINPNDMPLEGAHIFHNLPPSNKVIGRGQGNSYIHGGNVSRVGGLVSGKAPSIGDMARDDVTPSPGSVHPYSRDQSAPSRDAFNKRESSPMMIDGADIHNGNISHEVGGVVRGQAPSIGGMARDNVSQSSGSVHPYSGDPSPPSWDALNKHDSSPMMIDDDDV